MNISPLDIGVIAVYLIGITSFGIWIGFRRHTTTNQYFLANKSLGWFTVGAAVFTSNISTIHLVGLAAGGAKDGMVIGNFEWMACFTLILLALLFAPFYINSGVRTLPEFMERRYCPSARTFLAFIGLIGALLIHIGISLFAAAKVFESFLGVPMVATILVLSLFTVTYTALGGLKAVVMTGWWPLKSMGNTVWGGSSWELIAPLSQTLTRPWPSKWITSRLAIRAGNRWRTRARKLASLVSMTRIMSTGSIAYDVSASRISWAPSMPPMFCTSPIASPSPAWNSHGMAPRETRSPCGFC